MKDEIFYCSNIEQLKQELADNGMIDEDGNYTHGNTITPIVYNEVKTLSLVRNNKLNLTKFPSLKNLGTYEEMFPDEINHELYKSVYPYDVPIVYIGENETEKSYIRPQKIGEFA